MQSEESVSIDLVRIAPDQNTARFYSVAFQQTLFGEVSVLRCWGRIGTRGRSMTVTYENAGQAGDACNKLESQKRRRGYVGAKR